MPLVSSAQNQEDIMLWRALRLVTDGFYIDVGAADPDFLSVTRLFYEQGWHGINLEPDSAYFAALTRARPRDINLNLGAGREAAERVFYEVADTGLSTLDADIAARHKAEGRPVTERRIETLSLADICRRHRPEGPIHFLKIDVEGAEGEVLAGADFQAFRPWIVLVEATLPLSPTPSYAVWEPLLTTQGYGFVWFDGLNRFYVAEEKMAELGRHFQLPPNVFDGFETLPDLNRRAERAEASLAAERADSARTVRETAEALRLGSQAVQEAIAAFARQTAVVTEAQQRAGAAEQRAIAAEQRISLAEQRLVEAERQASAAVQRAITAEQQTSLAEQRLIEAERQASAAVQRAIAAEQQTSLAEQRLIEAERQASAAVQRAIAAEQQTSLTEQRLIEAERQASAAEQRFTEAERQRLELMQAQELAATALAATERQLRDSQFAEAEAQRRAAMATAEVAALRSSTSWRLTGPLRRARRLLQRRAPAKPAGGPPLGAKEIARRIFHGGAGRLLRLPGGRRASRLVRRVAPGPVEWLALRYRAYEARAAEPILPPPFDIETLHAAFEATQMSPLDLSDDEARLYRQIATSSLTARQGAAPG